MLEIKEYVKVESLEQETVKKEEAQELYRYL